VNKKLLIAAVSIVLLIGILSGCVEEETTTENTAPEAMFTWTADGLTVNFDASTSTDADEDTLTYSWDFGDDEGTDTGVDPIYTYADYGTYTVTLVVNDGTVDSAAYTAEVTIEEEIPAPNPPTVEMTMPDEIINGTAATFTATVTMGDANVSDTAYAWYVDDVLQGGNTSEFEYTFNETADFVVKVEVTDDDGLTGEASETVTVVDEEETE